MVFLPYCFLLCSLHNRYLFDPELHGNCSEIPNELPPVESNTLFWCWCHISCLWHLLPLSPAGGLLPCVLNIGIPSEPAETPLLLGCCHFPNLNLSMDRSSKLWTHKSKQHANHSGTLDLTFVRYRVSSVIVKSNDCSLYLSTCILHGFSYSHYSPNK